MKPSLRPFKSFSYPRPSAFIGGLFFVLLVPAAALAQHGGKAEPNRIEFKRGMSSTTISGTVSGSEEAEYVLAARQGQKLVIKLTSVPTRSAVLRILGDYGVIPEASRETVAYHQFSGSLPTTGDYLIVVMRDRSGKGRTRYRMTITIK
jgi:hypothetical protein